MDTRDTPWARLREARQRKYASASAAARALGIAVPTYSSHENGSRGFGRDDATRYAKAFGVEPAYLLMLAEKGDTILDYLRQIDERIETMQRQLARIERQLGKEGK